MQCMYNTSMYVGIRMHSTIMYVGIRMQCIYNTITYVRRYMYAHMQCMYDICHSGSIWRHRLCSSARCQLSMSRGPRIGSMPHSPSVSLRLAGCAEHSISITFTIPPHYHPPSLPSTLITIPPHYHPPFPPSLAPSQMSLQVRMSL